MNGNLGFNNKKGYFVEINGSVYFLELPDIKLYDTFNNLIRSNKKTIIKSILYNQNINSDAIDKLKEICPEYFIM